MVRRLFVLAIALLAIGCSSHSVAPAPGPISPQVFQKQPFNGPWLMRKLSRNTLPNDLAVGDKWYLWVADRGDPSITRIDLRGGARRIPLSFETEAIAIGSDQNVWVSAMHGGIIARVMSTGVETDFSLNDSTAQETQMIPGPDGNVWFTMADNNGNRAVGKIDTQGNITQYPQNYAAALVVGPDGNIWFSDNFNFYSMNTQGQIIDDYPFQDFVSRASVGPDGNIWFTVGDHLDRVTTAGQITQFPAPNNGLYDIVSWGGQLWMTDRTASKDSLLAFDPVGLTFGQPIASPQRLRRIITGQDGNFWMTGPNASVVIYVNQILSVNPTSLNLKVAAPGPVPTS